MKGKERRGGREGGRGPIVAEYFFPFLFLYQTSKRKEGMVSGHGGEGLAVGLKDPRGLFQP